MSPCWLNPQCPCSLCWAGGQERRARHGWWSQSEITDPALQRSPPQSNDCISDRQRYPKRNIQSFPCFLVPFISSVKSGLSYTVWKPRTKPRKTHSDGSEMKKKIQAKQLPFRDRIIKIVEIVCLVNFYKSYHIVS